MEDKYREIVTMDSSDFVLLADAVPGIVQEIRYYSTYNFVGDRIDGYEEPCALPENLKEIIFVFGIILLAM